MKPSEALRIHRAALRDIVNRNAALHPRVFGSAIHGDDTDDSDLDLLVDPTPSYCRAVGQMILKPVASVVAQLHNGSVESDVSTCIRMIPRHARREVA